MKTFLLVCIVVITGVSVVRAQELGVRFGDISAGHAAIDGVMGIGKFNRVHGDVSFGSGGVGVDLLWDFFHRPIGGAEGLSWYIGVGPFAFLGDPFQLGVVAEIGLEYHFKEIPLAIGADWRPFFRIVKETDFGGDGFGLNIRYVFNK